MSTAVVYSTGQTPIDVTNIQNAVEANDVVELRNTVAPDGTRTPFNFGESDVLYLSRDIQLVGAPCATSKCPANWRTLIQGGEGLKLGVKKSATGDQTLVQIEATIKNVRFEGFKGAAVRIVSIKGDSEISNCEFLHYKYGVFPLYKDGTPTGDTIDGAWPILTPSLAKGVTGKLTITGCHFGVPEPPPSPALPDGSDPGMNNLIHVSDCDLDLRIIDNLIDDMYWIGIAVWGNRGPTTITGNNITKTRSLAGLPGAGICFGARWEFDKEHWDGDATIEGNNITIGCKDSNGIVVLLYGEDQYAPTVISPPKITVHNNVVNMTNPDNKNAALACLGACSNSSWSGNVVTGTARYGIYVSAVAFLGAQPVGTPTNNTFEFNDLKSLNASRAQVFIDESVCQLYLRSNKFGTVSGSNFHDWPPPLTEPCAGIVCYGSDGEMILNNFANSDINGWWSQPSPDVQPPSPAYGVKTIARHVGCIYLDETSCRNRLEYFLTDFPKGTVPPPERQILDVSTSKWASKWFKKPAHAANVIIEVEKAVPAKPPKPTFGGPEPIPTVHR